MHPPSDIDQHLRGIPSGSTDVLLPLVRDLHAALGHLSGGLDAEFAELRARLDGRLKTHYTVDAVAELTGRAPYTVRSWIKGGLIRATRVSGTGPKGRLLVPREELQRLVASGRAGQLPAVSSD